MSTIIHREFATATIVHDAGSASGKSIAWPSSPRATVMNYEGSSSGRSIAGPRSPTASIMYDVGSASGKSIAWPCTPTAAAVHEEGSASGDVSCGSLRNALHTSVASTRANSPNGSCSTEDAECETPPSPRREGTGKMGVLRGAILKDLGVEFHCNDGLRSSPTTAAGSPYSSLASSANSSPSICTSASSLSASPVHLTATRPPMKDASQRSSTGILSSAFLRLCDASQRTPPQRVLPCTAVFSPVGGDASQRSPASRSYPSAGGSWAAATRAAAATHAAAVSGSLPAQAAHGILSTSAAACPVKEAGARGLQQADECTANPLKCWLAGVSDNSKLSSEDLAEKLLAALPETYED